MNYALRPLHIHISTSVFANGFWCFCFIGNRGLAWRGVARIYRLGYDGPLLGIFFKARFKTLLNIRRIDRYMPGCSHTYKDSLSILIVRVCLNKLG